MSKTKVTDVITKNNQPLKAITHHDIYNLKDKLEQLQSWKEPLVLMKNFFDNSGVPLNKKKIMKEFYANSQIFSAFYKSFIEDTETLSKRIDQLLESDKVKITDVN